LIWRKKIFYFFWELIHTFAKLNILIIKAMHEYPKINTMYKREMDRKEKDLLIGKWAQPEFEYLKDNQWEWTEKIDGTNIRVNFDGSEVLFGGRTAKADLPVHLLEKLKELFPKELMGSAFEPKDSSIPMNVTLYGEGYGAKIQKGGNYLGKEVGFILFDIRIGEWWLKRTDNEVFAEKLGIPIVPVIGYGTLQQAVDYVRNGFKSVIAQNKDYNAEGLVLKPVVDLLDRGARRIITKIKTCDFRNN